MPFFFSHASKNSDSYLRDFFDELQKAVEGIQTGLPAPFFDEESLKLGDLWDEKIKQNLATSRVFVAAITHAYAVSEYCWYEWLAFEERITAYAQGSEAPPLIYPVLWIPPAEPLPKWITERQYKYGPKEAVHNVKGLLHVCKLKNVYSLQFTEFIDELARSIVEMCIKHEGLDKITTVAEPSDLKQRELFQPIQKQAPSNVESKGPNRVYFVFGAAKGADILQAGKKDVTAYGGSGGEEWQPYFPTPKKIGSIAKQTAASDELNMWSYQLNLSPTLSKDIRQAEDQRELVVMFVDSWTATLPNYQQILQNFDRENYGNCSVIIPWNDQDLETKTNPKLMAETRKALKFRFGNQNELYLRAAVKSEAELRTQLIDVLTRLRAEVINKSVPDAGVVPKGGTQPVITGPGG